MDDICMICGKEVESKMWGGNCEKNHLVVHQEKCNKCDKVIGYIIDDDYCKPDHLYCPNCIAIVKSQQI